MIDYDVEGKGLWCGDDRREPPFMLLRCIVRGACGCWVACGMLLHNHEQGVSWHPCKAHRLEQPDNPQHRFLESLTADPQARPVEDVIAEMLA